VILAELAIHREACLVAVVLERLANERYVQEGELLPGIQITTRRVLLARLTKLQLRERLETWLNDLLLAPDGHWSDQQKHRVRLNAGCVYLRFFDLAGG
jgi:hypothetical protein